MGPARRDRGEDKESREREKKKEGEGGRGEGKEEERENPKISFKDMFPIAQLLSTRLCLLPAVSHAADETCNTGTLGRQSCEQQHLGIAFATMYSYYCSAHLLSSWW